MSPEANHETTTPAPVSYAMGLVSTSRGVTRGHDSANKEATLALSLGSSERRHARGWAQKAGVESVTSAPPIRTREQTTATPQIGLTDTKNEENSRSQSSGPIVGVEETTSPNFVGEAALEAGLSELEEMERTRTLYLHLL